MSHLVRLDLIWSNWRSLGSIWFHLNPLGLTWVHLVPLGHTMRHMPHACRHLCSNIRDSSSKLLRQYWRFATYLVGQTCSRCSYRVFKWSPPGVRSHGRAHNAWEDLLVAFCRHNHMRDWTAAAQDSLSWLSLTEDFVDVASP